MNDTKNVGFTFLDKGSAAAPFQAPPKPGKEEEKH